MDGAKAGVARERSTGYILKVVDGDERGQRELEFYQKIFNSFDPKLVKLRSFVSILQNLVSINAVYCSVQLFMAFG